MRGTTMVEGAEAGAGAMTTGVGDGAGAGGLMVHAAVESSDSADTTTIARRIGSSKFSDTSFTPRLPFGCVGLEWEAVCG